MQGQDMCVDLDPSPAEACSTGSDAACTGSVWLAARISGVGLDQEMGCRPSEAKARPGEHAWPRSAPTAVRQSGAFERHVGDCIEAPILSPMATHLKW